MSAQMLIPPLIFGLVQSADLDWCVSCARSDKNAQMHAPERASVPPARHYANPKA
jgi:hypothetical protein